MMPKRDHERDLELDKKIEALRRKNEVLMKRYKVGPVPAGGTVEVQAWWPAAGAGVGICDTPCPPATLSLKAFSLVSRLH